MLRVVILHLTHDGWRLRECQSGMCRNGKDLRTPTMNYNVNSFASESILFKMNQICTEGQYEPGCTY